MSIDIRTALVSTMIAVFGLGQPLAAQTHPSSFSESQAAEGPIARATALEIAKLENVRPGHEFGGSHRLLKGAAPRAETTGAAVRQSKRGVIGAIVGAAAGAVLGVGLALNYGTRDCGSSCTDERVMIGVSLVGIPVAAGIAGYHIAK